MGDSNFQHFLKVLEEVVAEKPKECDERRLKTIPEKEGLCSRDGSSETLAPIWDVKAVKSKYKLRRHPLRRPGFIYRSRDFSKTSFLRSNIWEYKCGRKVLKSPTFKYQEKRKLKTSPYSMQILEGFSSMSLGNNTPIHSCHANTVDLKCRTQTQDLSKNQPSFLPLSKCTDIKPKANVAYYSKRSKPFIRPSKLHRVSPSKRETKFLSEWCGSAKDCTKPLDCHAVMDTPSFGDLSDQIEPLVVRKFASRNFNEFRESSHSRHIDETSAAGNPTIDKPNNDLESEHQSTPRLTSGMKRSCSSEARLSEQDGYIDEMSIYMDDYWFFPQKMSTMAEMMYT